MNDHALGKRLVEEMTMEVIETCFPLVTGRSLECIEQGEAPDFVVRLDGVETGLEITEIRAGDEFGWQEEVNRLVDQKEEKFDRAGVFERPTVLLCYGSGGPALYRMRRLIDNDLAWLDRNETLFSEIWLMDTSAEFFSFQDARKAADFYCLWPPEKRGFYEQDRTRKPFG